MLSYSFSIFYYEIEKRKTKGRYIHGPGQYISFCILKGTFEIQHKVSYPLYNVEF